MSIFRIKPDNYFYTWDMGKKKILRVTEERKASVDHQSEHGLD